MKKLYFTYDRQPWELNPALQAWYKIMGTAAAPEEIDYFVGEHDRSQLYRFRNVRGVGKSVIAKSADPASLRQEFSIYTRILPDIPLDHLSCYGLYEEQDSLMSWLFLEEATGLSYEEADPIQVNQVSAWLGSFHAATATKSYDDKFPVLEFSHYRNLIPKAVNRMKPFQMDCEITLEVDQLMGRLEAHLMRLDSDWNRLERNARLMPPSIAHMDFVRKNVKIDFSITPPRAQVMDWGSSRRGIPVKDLAGLNIRVYQKALQPYGLGLSMAELEAAEQAGRMVKYLLFLHEELDNPHLFSCCNCLENMKLYDQAFALAGKIL